MRHEISRRGFILSASAGGLAVTSLLSSGPAAAEGAFTISSPGGSWGEGVRQAFVTVPKLEEKLKMNVLFSFDPQPQIPLAKLTAQPGNPPFSAAFLTDPDFVYAAQNNCLEDYDLDIVTNYQDIYPSALATPYNGLTHWAASSALGAIGLLWNTKECAKPESWNDLWNPKYKGRVGIPAIEWIGLSWLHAVNKGLGGTETNIDPVIQALVDLRKKNDPIILPNTDQAYKAITRGDIVMAPFWNGRTADLQANGVPVEIAYVKNSILFKLCFNIAKGTRFKAAANQFIQNTLDPVFQLEITKRFKYPPSNRKAKLPPEMERYRISEETLNTSLADLDWSVINKNRDQHFNRWNKEVIG
jgi:putative spermidine/putrescine transport system substrate-binding protein